MLVQLVFGFEFGFGCCDWLVGWFVGLGVISWLVICGFGCCLCGLVCCFIVSVILCRQA